MSLTIKAVGSWVRLIGLLITLVSPLSWANDARIRVVDGEGKAVENAVVMVANEQLRAAAQQQPERVPTPAVIDQVNRQFVPYMSTIAIGSDVVFPNSDNIRHHVYSFSQAKTFELKLYSDDERPSVRFDEPGIVTLGCNIHDQMIAYVVVTQAETGFITGADGKVSVPLKTAVSDLAIKVWHPQQQGHKKSLQELQVPISESVSEVQIAIEKPVIDKRPKSRLQERFNRTGGL